MNKILGGVALLGVGVVLFFVFSGSSSSPSLSLPAADFGEQYRASKNALLLDVRTPGEFRGGHIATAVNIDFESPAFESEIQKLDKTKTYFVYCRSGNRSGQAIAIMKQAGVENIYELRGGLVSSQNSFPLVTL